MRTAALTLSCLVATFAAAPATAEDVNRVVAGLNYSVSGGHVAIAQAVRVRRGTGTVLVRYPDARTEWVDAARLVSQAQPVSSDTGPYLFVVAALACLLDENGCVRNASAGAAASAMPAATAARAPARHERGKVLPVLATTQAPAAR